jgi:hypothetical protein
VRQKNAHPLLCKRSFFAVFAECQPGHPGFSEVPQGHYFLQARYDQREHRKNPYKQPTTPSQPGAASVHTHLSRLCALLVVLILLAQGVSYWLQS